MRSTILGFVAGAAFLQTRGALPGAWQIAACLLAALALMVAMRGPLRGALAGSLITEISSRRKSFIIMV